MNTLRRLSVLLALLALVAGGCASQPSAKAQADYDAEFTLTTSMVTGRMVFVGASGDIEGVINPDLLARKGDTVHVILINGDGMPHDFAIPDLNAQTNMVTGKGQTTDLVFEIRSAGDFVYYCTAPGHRQAGMEGKFIASEP